MKRKDNHPLVVELKKGKRLNAADWRKAIRAVGHIPVLGKFEEVGEWTLGYRIPVLKLPYNFELMAEWEIWLEDVLIPDGWERKDTTEYKWDGYASKKTYYSKVVMGEAKPIISRFYVEFENDIDGSTCVVKVLRKRVPEVKGVYEVICPEGAEEDAFAGNGVEK